MSILYFAACGISCFGPIVAIYKGTQVCEQPGTRWLMAVSALAYLLTQLVKSLLMVSLVPDSCSSYFLCEQKERLRDVVCCGKFEPENKYIVSGTYIHVAAASSFVRAVTQAFLRCIDFVGLCFTVHHKTALSFESTTRLLTVGLGWSLAHAVFTNLLPLLANFLGTAGFQWRYLYGALAASSSIISWTALAALAFLMTRRRKQQPLLIVAADAFPSAGIVCAVLLFLPFFCGPILVLLVLLPFLFVSRSRRRIMVDQPASTAPGESMGGWLSLCIQTAVNIVAAAFTLQIYYAKVKTTLSQNSGASATSGGRTASQVQGDSHTDGSRVKGAENFFVQD